MTQPIIEVEGVKTLIDLFKSVDSTLTKTLTETMRGLAREVATRAKGIAIAEGFGPPGRSGRGTGQLVEDIGSGASGGTGYVRDTAINEHSRDFKYPAVYEFGHSKWGHRPFLMPAVEASQEHIYTTLERMLDELFSKHGL